MAARTIKRGSLTPPSDHYEWGVTSYLGKGSPFLTITAWQKMHLSIKGIWDWETRAKLLFDKFLKRGGIYHIWGHSLVFEIDLLWDKLERVLAYISHREDVSYLTNGEIFTSQSQAGNRLDGK